MLIVRPLDLDKEVDKRYLITNHLAVVSNSRGTSTFSQDGVFSTRIFGALGTDTPLYACEEGCLQSRFNEGVTCKECGTVVEYRGLSLEREGWIALNHVQIHPLFFRYIAKVVGKTAIWKILKHKAEIETSGTAIEPEVVPPYHNIGMTNFKNNFEEIMQYYVGKKPTADREFNMLMEHKEKVFIHYLPVMNSRLRPAVLVDGEFSFDEINIYYNTIIKNSTSLGGLTTLERIPSVTESYAYKIQETIAELYNSCIEQQSSKDGNIRGDLLGNRLNFTSRMVITPIDSTADIDEVDIPYITALELFKPSVLRELSKLKKISLSRASILWEKATRKFSPLIHKIVTKLARLQNVRLICNRNPTIAIGSVLLLRIRSIKTDMSDMTASIHNLILASMAADFDGDVLNFILIMSKTFVDFLEPFSPKNILINSDGKFNRDFLPSKDTSLALENLFA